jgi:CheY-like chemotaxis protein
MDIQMPEVDGLEVTRRIRSRPEFKDKPIIAITALAMPGDKERCFEAGANEYLAKPFNLNILVEMVQQFLDQGT